MERRAADGATASIRLNSLSCSSYTASQANTSRKIPVEPTTELKERAIVGEDAGNANADVDAAKETDEEDDTK